MKNTKGIGPEVFPNSPQGFQRQIFLAAGFMSAVQGQAKCIVEDGIDLECRPSPYFNAALMKPVNNGCGSLGRDLNSG